MAKCRGSYTKYSTVKELKFFPMFLLVSSCWPPWLLLRISSLVITALLIPNLTLSCSLMVWTVSHYVSHSVIPLLTVNSLGIFPIKISKSKYLIGSTNLS